MQLLVVLGMHRSGTSLVAGMLRALGWDVGPDGELMQPQPDNPRGFVEHLPAVRINDRLLFFLGGSWKEPPALPDGWEHRKDLDDLRAEAAEVVERLARRGSDRVLLKDPRFSLTLPFWHTVVDVDQVVLVLRPPRPVVRSLLRREAGLDTDVAATLWLRYTLTALRLDLDLHVAIPDVLVSDLDTRLPELATALGHDPSEQELSAAAEEIADDLWGRSSRRADSTPLEHPALAAAEQVHAALVGPDARAWRAALGRLTTVEELATADRRLAAQHTELTATADDLRDRVRDLGRELERTRQRADRYLAEREQARSEQ